MAINAYTASLYASCFSLSLSLSLICKKYLTLEPLVWKLLYMEANKRLPEVWLLR
jgi:hypothetical protein